MNVLVYVMDALRADFLSCYGHGDETSPRIDAFAGDAVRFANAYSTATWTKPAGASLLTGRQPRAINAMRLLDRVPDLDGALQRRLGAAGFDTAAVSANAFVAPEFGFTGFDEFTHLQKDPTAQQQRRSVEVRGREDAVIDALEIDSKVVPLSEDVNEVLFDAFEGRGADDDAFALAWSIDTHGPYFVRGDESAFGNDPTKVISESELSTETADEVRSIYRDMVRYNDRQFGRLLDFLREEGLYDETMVVLLADHGESFGDHGKFFDRPIFGHSGVVYEELVTVPLFVKFPGGEYAGRTVDDLVQITDLYPTIVDVCGVEPPDGLDGQSLYPPETPDDRTVFVESQPTLENVYSGAVRRGDHKLLRIEKDWRWRRNWRRMAETLLWKFAVPRTRLFDLEADPGETADCSDERAELTAALAETFGERRDALEAAGDAVAAERLDAVESDTRRHLEALGYLE